MNPTDPFQFLADLLGAARDKIGAPKLPTAPVWLSHEIRNRLLLLINHVLQQHPAAQQRLLAHTDKVLLARWNRLTLRLRITPAGLFALADDSLREHLHLQVDDSAAQLARQAVQGQRPQVHISGDTELADTIDWLADNVRWNSEADLARLIGEPAAQRTVQVLRQVRQALQGFVNRIVPMPEPSAHPHMGEATDAYNDWHEPSSSTPPRAQSGSNHTPATDAAASTQLASAAPSSAARSPNTPVQPE